MNTNTACLSMLHEDVDSHSGTRLFRAKPVLDWTLSRLSRTETLDNFAILCWEDQLERIRPIADRYDAHVLAKGPRKNLPQLQAISAARRWADGWRGGLLGSCDFDLGFHGPWVHEIATRLASDAVLLVDPASGLIDPVLLDELVDHAEAHPQHEFCFTQAAPGLNGVYLHAKMLERFAKSSAHLGTLLQYRPEAPMRDAIGTDSCAPVPTIVARTSHRFKLDSDRQIARMDRATFSLNGTLIVTEAEEIATKMAKHAAVDFMPREVVIELTTDRMTKPVFSPLSKHDIRREEMSDATGETIINELKSVDDIRLTVAGVGDPLLHRRALSIISTAHKAGIQAIHVETDLLACTEDSIEQLINTGVDVISVHLPGGNGKTYSTVMNHDGMGTVMNHVKILADAIIQRGQGVPLIVPVFTKCAANLHEMEACYDHWIKALGHCVIAGPTEFGELIPFTGAADMTPPKRVGCRRLNSRMTILSDGSVVSCEEDVLGQQSLGKIGESTIKELWQKKMAPLREAHAGGRLEQLNVCGRCKEWHRP